MEVACHEDKRLMCRAYVLSGKLRVTYWLLTKEERRK